MEILEPGRRNIVVLGAGFGGVTALLKIRGLLNSIGWQKGKGRKTPTLRFCR